MAACGRADIPGHDHGRELTMLVYGKLMKFCKAAGTYQCVLASYTFSISKESAELDDVIRFIFRWYRAGLGSVRNFKHDAWSTRCWALLALRRIKFYGK
ncbi:hypothetical protein BV22DRAFT_320460 [Leucogyrophana mollusca]|uniref:Uncharacterized protein n=1 Tax=Leucogyrophana mollusca TaxID=85980 RepID=A0ACB8BMD7_9AGAM|nr:hypothetical protein BV22DRAFT_320460 [Leucogyrophana mollusca]